MLVGGAALGVKSTVVTGDAAPLLPEFLVPLYRWPEQALLNPRRLEFP